jgi:hypothetical protein
LSFDFFTQLILKLKSAIRSLLKLILFLTLFILQIRSIGLPIQIGQFLGPILQILNLVIFEPAHPLSSQTGLRPDSLLNLRFTTDIGNGHTDLRLHDWFVFLDSANELLVVLGFGRFGIGGRLTRLGLVELCEKLLRLEKLLRYVAVQLFCFFLVRRILDQLDFLLRSYKNKKILVDTDLGFQ